MSGAWLTEWRAADSATRDALLRAHVRETVARAMTLKADALDTAQPLLRLGLDSLMAVEVKRSLFTTLSVEIDLTAVLEGASTDDLTGAVTRLLDDAEAGGRDTRPYVAERSDAVQLPERIDADAARGLLQRLDQLSDAERDRLLERMLLES